MRTLATISAVVVFGAALASCDIPGSNQQTAAAPAPVAPPCNCGGAATMSPPPAPTEHLARLSYPPHHHHHGDYSDASYRPRSDYDADYSQQSYDTYDYRSSSNVTRSESSYSSDGDESSYGYHGGGGVVWVDGYGRAYFNSGPITVAATMRGRRLAPYHGYDVDCPERDRP